MLEFFDAREGLHRGVAEVEGGGQFQGVADEPGEKRAVHVPHRVAQGPVPRAPQDRLEGEKEQQAHDDDVEGGGAPVGDDLVDDDEEGEGVEVAQEIDEEGGDDEGAEDRLVLEDVLGDGPKCEGPLFGVRRLRLDCGLASPFLQEDRASHGTGVAGAVLDQIDVVVVRGRRQPELPVPALYQSGSGQMAPVLRSHGLEFQGQACAFGAVHCGLKVEGGFLAQIVQNGGAARAETFLPAQE